jgi:hypothetical protein
MNDKKLINFNLVVSSMTDKISELIGKARGCIDYIEQ